MSGRGRFVEGKSIFVAQDLSILNNYGPEVTCTFAMFTRVYEEYKDVVENICIILESSNESCRATLDFLSQLQSIEIEGVTVKVKPFEGQTRVLDISPIVQGVFTTFTISHSFTCVGFNPNYVIMRVPEIRHVMGRLTIDKIGVHSLPKTIQKIRNVTMRFTNLQSLPEDADLLYRAKLIVEGCPDLKISEAFYNRYREELHTSNPSIFYENGVLQTSYSKYDERKEFDKLPEQSDEIPESLFHRPKNTSESWRALLTIRDLEVSLDNIRVSLVDGVPYIFKSGIISMSKQKKNMKDEYTIRFEHNNTTYNLKKVHVSQWVKDDHGRSSRATEKTFIDQHIDILISYGAVPAVARDVKRKEIGYRNVLEWYTSE
jgi:hypothetical protein